MGGRIVRLESAVPDCCRPVRPVSGLRIFLVDPLAHKLLFCVGENMLASQLSVQRVKFNPLSLEATVDGLKLAEKSGAPLASFKRLYSTSTPSGALPAGLSDAGVRRMRCR